jgi:tetratricopeptide (TPR) repeat protein
VVLLSAALIVRDEERLLEPCLRSIAALVDEIVVVDTGSTDRSVAIARAHGAQVHEVAWTGDFSAARNRALDLARGAWVLYIDADERARPCAPEAVRAQLMEPAYLGYRVLFHPRPGHTAYRELRLFRRDPRIRFRGVIHESMWPDVDAVRAADGGRIGESVLALDHVGYEGDQRPKHARNLPLLERALAADPGRIFSWCHLARIHEELGNEPAAQAAWDRALAVARAADPRHPDGCLAFAGAIRRGFARGDDVAALLDEASARYPTNLGLVWFRGRALLAAGQPAEAIPCFERLLAAGESGAIDRSWSYDERILGVFPHAALASAHWALARYEESCRHWAAAARADPTNLEYRAKLAACARLARRGATDPARALRAPR